MEETSTDVIINSNENALNHFQKVYVKYTSQVTQDMEQAINITKLGIATTTNEQEAKWNVLHKKIHVTNAKLIQKNIIAIKNHKVMTKKVATRRYPTY